jgi:beta-lactamase superfamily II metal-dependent hydrolase
MTDVNLSTAGDGACRSLEIVILDVGHGNCAVVYDGAARLIVDVAQETILLEELRFSGNRSVDHLVLSHADADHIRGAAGLLAHSDFEVGCLWSNADSTKDSDTFLDLMYAARDRHKAGRLRVKTSLNVGADSDLCVGGVKVEVLHPGVVFGMRGPSSRRRPEGVISSNSMSAVLRVGSYDQKAVLLPGDLDHVGLQSIVDEGVDISAPVLVFPHHGGRSGSSNDRDFARRLCSLVSPKLVIFSHGRHNFRNPRKEIVDGIRDALGAVDIICTQLSRSCHASTDVPMPMHLNGRPSRGRLNNSCCGGSITVWVDPEGVTWSPEPSSHARYLDLIDTPLCRAVKA